MSLLAGPLCNPCSLSDAIHPWSTAGNILCRQLGTALKICVDASKGAIKDADGNCQCLSGKDLFNANCVHPYLDGSIILKWRLSMYRYIKNLLQ